MTPTGPAPPACGGGPCTVFVYILRSFPGNFDGGLAAADGICQVEAREFGLAGTYKAWLSDDATSPSTRFTHAAQPYVLPNGAPVALNWDDLTDSGTGISITVGPDGQSLPEQRVWTGTFADGTGASSGGSPANCGGWTGAGQGLVGTAGRTDAGWSDAGVVACGQQAGGQQATATLYCFQQ